MTGTTPFERQGAVRLALLRAAAAGAPVRLCVAGECMAPELRPGDVVEVTARRWYWPGDPVAITSAQDEILIHRLIGYAPGRGGLRLVTQGDRVTQPDRPAPVASVLGVVTRVVDRGPVTVSVAARLHALGRFLGLVARWALS